MPEEITLEDINRLCGGATPQPPDDLPPVVRENSTPRRRPWLLEPVNYKLEKKAKLVKKFRQTPNTPDHDWYHKDYYGDADETFPNKFDESENTPQHKADIDALNATEPNKKELTTESLYSLIGRIEQGHYSFGDHKDGLDAANELFHAMYPDEYDITLSQLVDDAWQLATLLAPASNVADEADPTPASFATFEDYEAFLDAYKPSVCPISRDKWILLKTDPEQWEMFEVKVTPDEPTAMEPTPDLPTPHPRCDPEYLAWVERGKKGQAPDLPHEPTEATALEHVLDLIERADNGH